MAACCVVPGSRSRPLAGWFLYSSNATVMESPLDRNFIIMLSIAGFFILFKKGFNFSLIMQENKFIIFLAVYMLVSIFWSDILFISLKRWIRGILNPIIMSFVIFSENNAYAAMQSVLRRTIYILIPFSLCLIKYFPLYGVQYNRWKGS